MKLVIVESPAKAKTISKYLGKDFHVVASFGHIRNLESKPGSVLPDKDFQMKFVMSAKSTKYVGKIVDHAKDSDMIYLATDPDREGEAIAWHVMEVLIERKVADASMFKRVVFHEITKKAVLNAVSNPRDINENLVYAQQARSALDYLVGFTLSPVLWRKLPGCKSAGRVQSVALRLLCEREDEIERFISEEYWDIELSMLNEASQDFKAKLTHAFGDKLTKFSIRNQQAADNIVDEIKKHQFYVDNIETKQQKRNPYAPYITSSLQQDASRYLGFGAKKTMQIAQKLYEGVDLGAQESAGLITYMRTDSVSISQDAINEIRGFINDECGPKYLNDNVRLFKSKVQNAQEAHEAIRPTNVKLLPSALKNHLDDDQLKLYNLVWVRAVASQMSSAVFDQVCVDLATDDKKFIARANGSKLLFDGYMKIYNKISEYNKNYAVDDEENSQNSDVKYLPEIKKEEQITVSEILPKQHFTEPPGRYSEASLVKKLESLGIGRPSTYANIISLLQDRNYADLDRKRFVPTELGRVLNAFLVSYFLRYVEYDFTANLEEDLDKIAHGTTNWKNLLDNFWKGFDELIGTSKNYSINEVLEKVQSLLDFHIFGASDSEDYNKHKKCFKCNDGKLQLKLSKYGAFLACSNYPDCNANSSINAFRNQADGDVSADTSDGQKKNTQNNNSSDLDKANIANDKDKLLGYDKDSQPIYLRKGPYGLYVQAGDLNSGATKSAGAKKSKNKVKKNTVPSNFQYDEINLNIAQKLLDMPYVIGKHNAEDISINIGRFGPYLIYQGHFCSIPKRFNPLTIELDDAIALIEKKLAKVNAGKGKK